MLCVCRNSSIAIVMNDSVITKHTAIPITPYIVISIIASIMFIIPPRSVIELNAFW